VKAVRTAAAIPTGVKEFRDRARYTSASVAGIEIQAFILLRFWRVGSDLEGGAVVVVFRRFG
jgi:hypothetical protein